ncbi:MAG TPA: hypothetical protein VGB71_04680 [Flavisolibacter sp.]
MDGETVFEMWYSLQLPKGIEGLLVRVGAAIGADIKAIERDLCELFMPGLSAKDGQEIPVY